MKGRITVVVLLITFMASCSSVGKESVLNTFPIDVDFNSESNRLVWVGSGETSIFTDGQWISTPSSDYTFMVYQQRFEDQWKSHKIMNRLDENYNGSGGEADQQHLFVVKYDEMLNNSRNFNIMSTMGNGEGIIDESYENAVMFIDAGISSFAPYSHIRLTQKYDYSKGKLDEIIELVKLDKNSVETPFMRIIESATLFNEK